MRDKDSTTTITIAITTAASTSLQSAVDRFDADHEEAREETGSKGGRQSDFGGSSDNRHKYSRGFSDLYFARISHLICMENLVVRDAAFAPSFSTAYTRTPGSR